MIKGYAPGKYSYSEEISHLDVSIKEKLLKKSAKQPSRKRLTSLVRFYQSSLIRLIDELGKKKCPCKESTKCHSTHLLTLSMHLINSLSFIHQQFNELFDSSLKLPDPCETRHRDELQKRLKKLIHNMISLPVSSQLLFALLHPLTDFVSKRKREYTFHDKHFLYAWLENLESNWQLLDESIVCYEHFCKQLIAFNLNSVEGIQFFIEFFTEKYQIENSKNEQLTCLKHFYKCINQVTIVITTGLNPQKPSLQKTLKNWLEQEISFIENTCHINERSMTALNSELINTNKITTRLSVAQLGCFIRICVDSGILPEQNKKQLITFFTNHFSTNNQENISYSSLKNKFYDPENSSIAEVKSIVLKQLKLLQENNF
jgi:hypothetical protein